MYKFLLNSKKKKSIMKIEREGYFYEKSPIFIILKKAISFFMKAIISFVLPILKKVDVSILPVQKNAGEEIMNAAANALSSSLGNANEKVIFM